MSNQKIDSTQVDFQTGASLTVKEADGAPTVSNVDTIVVSNGTLTDDGAGQVTLTTGGGGGTDANAIHVNASGEIAALTSKATPVDADVTVIEDSAASNGKKKLTWANIKATLKTYFDTLYAVAAKGVTNGDSHDHAGGDGGTIAYANVSGTPTIPTGANPTATIGASATNGSAATFMRSDGAPALADAGVTYAKIQNISAADKLLGRGNGGGAGVTQEITLGTNLSMSGTTLNAGGTAVDSDAIHDNVANEISAITEKTTLANDDLFIIEDSAASYVKKKVKKSNVSSGGGGYPQNATIWCDEFVTEVAGTWVNGRDTNLRYQTYTQNTSSNDADAVEFTFFLKAGTYTLYALGIASGSYGKTDITIDGGSVVATFDWYSGVTTYNVVKSQASVVVATDGQHTLRLTLNGKNVSSTDYDVALTKLWFH